MALLFTIPPPAPSERSPGSARLISEVTEAGASRCSSAASRGHAFRIRLTNSDMLFLLHQGAAPGLPGPGHADCLPVNSKPLPRGPGGDSAIPRALAATARRANLRTGKA